MDKYIEVFCKQNPKMTFPCGNPSCRKEQSFKTKDVFKSASFSFKCNYCGNTTHIDSAAIAKDFTSQIKRAGITVR